MKSLHIFVGFFMVLTASCGSEAIATGTNLTTNTLVGTWQLSETYISPGGATEWMDVTDGFMYRFDTNGTFSKTESNGTAQETGKYRIEENELFLEFELEGEPTTLGYRFEKEGRTITLSPSFPAICFEVCLYRFKRK